MSPSFGKSIGPAEADICAANYLRHRVTAVSEVVQRMLDALEARAAEFMERGERSLREVVVDEGQSQAILAALTAYLAKSEPDAEQVALCNRMIIDAGASDELNTVLWLLGEEMALPPAERQAPQVQPMVAPKPAAQPRQPAARAQGERRTQQQAKERAAAAPASADEFFGVNVPRHEIQKARTILADAAARAAGEGRYEDSPYVSGRGLNAWQPKLLRAAYDAAIAELAPRSAAEPEEGDAPGPAVAADAELAAEIVEDDFLGDEVEGSETMEAEDGVFAEPLDDGRDDAVEMTLPLAPPPRPQPTVLTPPAPASRVAPPPVRPAGLMASNVRPPPPRR